MAIKVSGVNVIDNERNASVAIATATSLDVSPLVSSFSPTDGSSDVAVDSNIVITYNTSIAKGTGNITLKEDDPSTGNVIETIDVTSGSVSVSGGQATINPSSDLPTGKNIYVVVAEGCFKNGRTFFSNSVTKELNTYNFSTGPITVSSFSPSDGATGVAIDSNIVITFSENITKETTAATKYITLKAGSASGTTRQTIDVSTSAVTVSGTQATINPPSDLEYSEDTYVVVDENSFFNSDGDEASGNAVINTYNFTTEADIPPLGQQTEGGYLICCSGGNLWIAAPFSTQVCKSWYQRNQALQSANANAACGDWFIPSCSQLKNPGYVCRTYYQSPGSWTWSNTEHPGPPNYIRTCCAFGLFFPGHISNRNEKTSIFCVRAFRCVSY